MLSRCATSPCWFRSRLAESRSLERSIQGLSSDRFRGYASDARPSLISRRLWAFACVACNPPNLAIVVLALRLGWGLCNRPFLPIAAQYSDRTGRFVAACGGSYPEIG